MRGSRRRAALVAAALLAMAPSLWAQKDPHIGYVFPAGGRQGSTFEVTVGGQYLEDVSALHVSGEGLRAEVLEYLEPPTGKQIKALSQRLRELRGQDEGAGEGEQDDPEIMWRGRSLSTMSRMELIAILRELRDPKRQLNPQISERVRLRISIDPGAAPGQRELRLAAPRGLSNPLCFHVGRLAEVVEQEPNDAQADPGLLGALPVVVNGQVLPGDVDRFRFTARKDQRLVAAASARALIPYLADAVPGWFQATLALHDADGNELAYADDFRFHPDPVLFHVIPEDGDYVLEIKDSLYRGREDFVYRIALGELPFVSSIFPLGGPAGEPSSLQLQGWNLPADRVALSGEESGPGVRSITVDRDGMTSNRVPYAAETLPEDLEQEPNGSEREAQRLQPPLIVNGRIGQPGDRDVFRFKGRAGEEIVIEVRARRLGSPLDSVLVLTDAAGRQLAVNDDHEDRGAGLITHHADSRLTAELPADGSYLIRLEDAQRGGGEAHGYRLRVSPPRPDFALRVVPSSLNVRAGGTVPLTVYALRRDGFSGAIELGLADPPEGFVLGGGTVPAGQEEVRLTLTAPPDAPEALERLDLEGRAVIAGRVVDRSAVPADDRMQAFLYRHLVPAQDLMVAVTEGRRARLPLRPFKQTTIRLRAGKTARLSLPAYKKLESGQVEIALNDPPPGIAIREIRFAGRSATLVLEADEALPECAGNLIFEVFARRTLPRKESGKEPRVRRIPLGFLPALRFEIVAPKRRTF